MKKIHLHIEQLSLPGYTPAERREFIAALEQELSASGIADNTAMPRLANHESMRVNTPDLRPQTVARNAVLGMNSGIKSGGRT